MPSRSKNTLAILTLCLFGLACPAVADIELRPPESWPDAESVCSMMSKRPNTKGYVDLSFTVTKEGTVRDPGVITTVVCEDLFYDDDYDDVAIEKLVSEFEKAAIRAVLKFKYKPRIIDGEAVDVPGVKTRISFQLEDEPDDAEDESAEPSQPED